MSNRCTRTLSSGVLPATLTAAAFLALPFILDATDIPIVRGQLHAQSREMLEGLFVGMEEITSHTDVHRVDLGLDGSFEFRGVPTGDYTLRVTDIHGETVMQQYVTVREHMPELIVTLTESAQRPESKSGTVSLTQLLHPPEKKAVQAFQSASRFSSSGKYDEAVAELEKAIRISPAFAQAYTNLAVQHIRLGRYEESAAESARALQIGGPDPVNLCNLAFAQFHLHHYAEAQASARAALHLEPSYLQAHLVLGSILANAPATRDEGIRHLELAAEKFPSARAYLARLQAAR